MPTFVQRSAVASTGGGAALTAHGSAAVGDKQIIGIASHASVTPSTPTGFTLLTRTTTTHSSLTLFTRTVDAGNIASDVAWSAAAYHRGELRTYRDVSAFTAAGNGTELVSPSRVVDGILIRFTANARDNIGGGSSNGGQLTPDAALSNASPATVWDWYNGVVAGDDPTADGGTAPARTATETRTETDYPQWVDVSAAGLSIDGSFALTLPAPTVAFSGTYVPPAETGAFDITLPTPVVDFAGTYQAPPTGTFALDLPVPVVDFAGTYTPPVDPTGSFAITLPTPVVDFAGTYIPPPITGSFAIDLPLPVVEFTGLASAGIGSFAIELPIPTVAFEGTYGGPYPTDTSNALDGRSRHGRGTATRTVPVAAPPAGMSLGTLVDKALAYPAPTMDEGRPT